MGNKNLTSLPGTLFADKNTYWEFVNFESALYALNNIAPTAPVSKGYLLFTKYHWLGRQTIEEDRFFLQQASVLLKKYRSKTIWDHACKEYFSEEYKNFCLYVRTKDEDILTDNPELKLQGEPRKKEYLERILCGEMEKTKGRRFKDKICFWFKDNAEDEEHKWVQAHIDKEIWGFAMLPEAHGEQNEKRMESLPPAAFTRQELLDAAAEIEEKLPDSAVYRVLSRNVILQAKENELQAPEQYELHEITNLVGMVGAGKTMFLRAAAYLLAKRGLRILILQDTVANVMKMYRFFKELGMDCSPLIGKGGHDRYSAQLREENEDFLGELYSPYLSAVCLWEGFDTENRYAAAYGDEPCFRLYPGVTPKEGEKIRRGTARYQCPFLEKCPVCLAQRKALGSRIVVTTPAGWVSIRDTERNLFLEHTICSFDIVFADESDAVQVQLDSMFMPQISFDKFIHQTGNSSKQYLELSNDKRMRDKEMQLWHEIVERAPSVIIHIVECVKTILPEDRSGFLRGFFSAWLLLLDMEKYLPAEFFKRMRKILRNNTSDEELSALIYFSCQSAMDGGQLNYLTRLSDWMNEIRAAAAKDTTGGGDDKVYDYWDDDENVQKLQVKMDLFFVLVYLDRLLLRLADNFGDSDNPEIQRYELLNFIRTRFHLQQEYLPSSLLGNLLGIHYEKGTADVTLFRQYAMGRTLLTRLPWIRVNAEGRPLGPHVVLLSGSSFIPGSWAYHVHTPVNYMMEAPQEVRTFLQRTEFVDLAAGTGLRFSGSYEDRRRMDILRELALYAAPHIRKDLDERKGKILLVVNSYEQAEIVYEVLSRVEVLLGAGDIGKVRMLQREQTDSSILLSEISGFDRYPERILVAPAITIARGYNIVDEKGHSSFTSLYLLTRPLTNPTDLTQLLLKVNGSIAEEMSDTSVEDVFAFNREIREKSVKAYAHFLKLSMSYGLSTISDHAYRRDAVAGLFVLILQVFGRLCRITDTSREAPKVYFVDGAFHRNRRNKRGFDMLEALIDYLKTEMESQEYGKIVRSLYEPFYEPLKKMREA